MFDPTRAKSIIVSSETDQIDLAAQALADVGYQLFGDLIQTSSQAGVPLQLTANDTNQWAPRIGFAYRLGDRTVDSRRLRHVLRSRRHERPTELPLPAVQHERDRERRRPTSCRTARRPTIFLGVPFGASVGSVGWNPLTLDARLRVRPALELRLSARDRQPHEPRNELRRDQGQNQQEAENDQPSRRRAPGNIQARRPYPRFGNMSIHSQARSTRVSRAADEAPEADVGRLLVSRVAYVVADA